MKHRYWLLPLSGAVFGYAFWLLAEYFSDDLGIRPAGLTFIAALAFCSWFALGVRNLRDDLLFVLGVSLLAGLQVWAFQMLVGFEHIESDPQIALIGFQLVWVFIAVAMWRVWMRPQTTVLPERPERGALVPEIWVIKVSLAFGLLLVAIVWPVLFALSELFNLIDLRMLGYLLDEGWFASLVTGTAFATGLLVAKEKPRILKPVRQIVGGLLRILYPVQALGVFIFLIAIALGGWNVLVAQNYSGWWAVTTAAVGLGYLLFGALQTNNRSTLFGRRGDKVFRVTLWMTPVLGAIALYAIWLRVAEYGLSPSRVYGIWTSLFVLFASVLLAVAAFGRRQSMADALRNTFGHVLICLAITAFVINLPLLDPISMSARSQQARLLERMEDANLAEFDIERDKSLAVSWSDIDNDLDYMLSYLGRPGARAFEAISEHYPNLELDGEQRLKNRMSGEKPVTPLADIPVLPEGHGVAENEVALLLEEVSYQRQYCRNATTGEDDQCLLLLIDLDGDGVEEALFFNAWPYALLLSHDLDGDGWNVAKNLTIENDDLDREALIADIKKGDFELVSPRYPDIRIGSSRLLRNE